MGNLWRSLRSTGFLVDRHTGVDVIRVQGGKRGSGESLLPEGGVDRSYDVV